MRFHGLLMTDRAVPRPEKVQNLALRLLALRLAVEGQQNILLCGEVQAIGPNAESIRLMASACSVS